MIKRLLIVSFVCSVCGAIAPTLSAAERAETLRAINWVENPTNHTRRGSKGELGPYQFRSQTWRLHTSKPFSLATVREHADEIAIKHYEWIKRGLREAGIDPSPFNIALAWNSGLGAVQRGEVPTVSYHYAERVANLVESQRAQRARPARETSVAVASNPPSTELAKPVFTLESAPEPGVRFSVNPAKTRFALSLEPIDEPVIYTGNLPSVVSANKAGEAGFTFASATAAAPRFALIQ